MYLFIKLSYNIEERDYVVSRTVKLSPHIKKWLYKYGKHTIYIDSENIMECYLTKEFQELVFEESTDSYQETEKTEKEQDEDVLDEDLKEKINDYFLNLKICHINKNHVKCIGKDICGCGCDPLHDGASEICDPFPDNVFRGWEIKDNFENDNSNDDLCSD